MTMTTTTTTTTTTTVDASTEAPLTVADRCDRCCAQARVRVRFSTGHLLFCGHHSARHAVAIAALAAAELTGDGSR
jgi:hypothetical protein